MGIFSGVLLASDLDGTLLNRKKQISAGNMRAIERFVAGGGLFTVATGRSKNPARIFLNALPLSAPAILCNGALLYDTLGKQPPETFLLPPSAAALPEEIAARFPDAGLELYRTDDTFLLRESEVSRRHFALIGEPYHLTPRTEIPEEGWLKLLVTGEPDRLGEVETALRASYGEQYQIIRSEDVYLEIFSKKTDKGKALLRVAGRYAIEPKWICAVGDHYNDLSMLRAADRALTPENGVPEVRTLACHLLPDCDKDAIAAAIEWIEETRQNT